MKKKLVCFSNPMAPSEDNWLYVKFMNNEGIIEIKRDNLDCGSRGCSNTGDHYTEAGDWLCSNCDKIQE